MIVQTSTLDMSAVSSHVQACPPLDTWTWTDLDTSPLGLSMVMSKQRPPWLYGHASGVPRR